MLKRLQVFIFSFFLLVNLFSCSAHENELLNNEYKNKVEFTSLKNGTHSIEYLGNVYYPFFEDIKFVEYSENDFFLGWNGTWWGYQNQYYSYSNDNPIFIYETRIDCLYFHEKYDYATDTFIIESTSAEIIWKDVFSSQSNIFLFSNPTHVVLYSKQCPRIRAELTIECNKNRTRWYVSLSNSSTVWIASDAFVEILSENGII